MEILAGEDVAKLAENGLQEFEGGVLTGAEDIRRHSPDSPDFVVSAGLYALARAAEPGVGRQRRDHMAGEVHLRDDGDAELGRIFDHVAHLFLGVETAMALAVEAELLRLEAALVADDGLRAPCSDFGEERVGLDLGAPALVLGEVPVEAVELEGSHHVEDLLDLVHREEVAAAVQMHSAICEARFVLDLAARQLPFGFLIAGVAVDGNGHELLEGLDRIEETVVRVRLDHGFLFIDIDGVSLVHEGRVHGEDDALALPGANGLPDSDGLRDRVDLAGDNCHLSRQLGHGCERNLAHLGIARDLRSFKFERALVLTDAQRLGDDVDRGRKQHRKKS